MKKKLHITERNFINLIKKIVLEQTDDMDTPESLAQRQQQQLAQPAAQPAAQRPVACSGGYRQKEKGPYALCDESTAIQKLQKHFRITEDGKLGPTTLRYIRYFFQDPYKINVSDDDINNIIKQSAPDAVGTTSKSTSVNKYNPVGPLKTLNGNLIKISNSSYAVESIYASYRTNWENGEFTIYINVNQTGSVGSKKYKFGTNCSLLKNNIIKIVGSTTNYSFDDSTVSKTIINHFCQIKSNQA
jgi:hypothetical protein